jgi:hypothetical protein
MKIFNTVFVKITFLCLLINTSNLLAQTTGYTHILYEKNKAPKEGTLISINENAITFADSSGQQKVFHRMEVDSVVQGRLIDIVEKKTVIAQILEAYPDIKIDENLKINSLTQEHSLTTTWGQKYAGIIVSMSVEKLYLTTQNGMNLPFKIKEINAIKVIASGETVKKTYKTLSPPSYTSKVRRKERAKISAVKRARKQTHIPYRISVVPTAFNLPKGQILFRESAGYLREFVFADQYFSFSGGLSGWYAQLRLKTGIPIKKYLHAGLVVELTGEELSFSRDRQWAIAPILTLGTPSYFLNLVYKSDSPMFIPVNDRFDNSIINLADYWSFGAGVRITDNLQFLTESLLIESDNRQKHYRVFLGFTIKTKIQTIGAGVSVWDTDEFEDDFFFQANFGNIIPSFQYTIRFR